MREEIPLERVCVLGDAAVGAESFSVGAPVRVSFGADLRHTCRPACDTIVEARCSLSRDGNTFRVQGRVVVEVDCHGVTPLPVCSVPGAECATGPLEAGEYVVTDGVHSVTFRVPSTVRDPIRCSS